ncbi:PAS domain S-box protein [Natronorubrum halophilum]|uniref:PAS domain S-box protein n=1 Tax=Natronorubrum halophilum TaxID=1702106 RepID=UPI000EF6FBBD|nr:PAS domain S-box protein [Natronorubrum halophilum]
MKSTGESNCDTAHPSRIRVLHVDDEPEFADRTAAALERERDAFDTITATTARDGLELLEETRIDCIVSEYDMPEMDGLAFLERVQCGDEATPFILFTGSGSEALASEAITAGVTDYFQKGDGASQYPVLANRIVNAVETTRTRRQRNHQLRAIETAQEGISLLDADGTFSYMNRSYADCFGYEPSALIGEHWDVLYTNEEAATVHEEVLPTVMDEGYWRGETVGLRADGTQIIVDHTLSTTDHGELICTVRDVTDRKDRERDLERYETIIEALGDPVYTVDSDGRCAFVNDAYAEMTGYTKAELIGKPVSFLLDESSAGRGTDVVRELLSSETTATQQTYEITVVTKDGTRIQCEDNVSLLPLEDGQYRGVAGVVRNITERKDRERELEQYETILRTIPDEVYMLDADGYVTNVVPPTGSELTTTGYRPAELRGEHVSVILSDDDIARGEVEIRRLLKRDDREKASFEMTPITRDGDRVPNENHIALLPTDDGTFRGTVGVLRDITDRKERERELKRQNERLESFASIVSHDLRNPLNVAQGQLELAREEHDESRLRTVSKAHERMQRLIDDILRIAREDDPVTETEPIDLAAFARSCWQHVETEDATLNAETDAVVQADRSRFERLVENLIRNAVEHSSTSHSVADTPEDAVENSVTGLESQSHSGVVQGNERDGVTLTVGSLPGRAGFYVEDDGPGIPPEDRDAVFETGYSTTTDGTGFGLSIVERIADAHGWTVTVVNGDSGGARFEFRDVEVRR